MRDGFPVRMFFELDSSALEFYPIYLHVRDGNGGIVSREVIDVHTGMIFRPRFKSLVDATVVADTDKSGYLLIGGGRLKPNGEPAEREVFWAYWKNHADERGELLVRDGLPRRFGS